MVGSMNFAIETMLNVLKGHAECGAVFDVLDIYERLTLDIITRTAFGFRTDVHTDSKSKLLASARAYFSVYSTNIFVFVGLCFPLLKPLCCALLSISMVIKTRGSKISDSLAKIIKSVLEHRRKCPQEKHHDILQYLTDSQIPLDDEEMKGTNQDSDDGNKLFRKMSHDEIISNSYLVFLAGYETTSVSLSFLTYLIAKHQDVQQRLFEEIISVSQTDEELDFHAIQEMSYLDKVINESLRLYSTSITVTRYASEDVQYGDVKIPKGMLVQVPLFLLQRDPELWDEPEEFNPDRFDSKMNQNGIRYMPFGVGPRDCLGKQLGRMELKLTIAQVLKKFKIILASDPVNLELCFKLSIASPKNGVPLKILLR